MQEKTKLVTVFFVFFNPTFGSLGGGLQCNGDEAKLMVLWKFVGEESNLTRWNIVCYQQIVGQYFDVKLEVNNTAFAMLFNLNKPHKKGRYPCLRFKRKGRYVVFHRWLSYFEVLYGPSCNVPPIRTLHDHYLWNTTYLRTQACLWMTVYR